MPASRLEHTYRMVTVTQQQVRGVVQRRKRPLRGAAHTKVRSSWLGTGVPFIAGSVCWIDVSSTDPAGSRDFYAGLFGWTYRVDPKPGSGQDTTALCAGQP